MKVDGVPYRSIWLAEDGRTVEIIDQTVLPHEFNILSLETLEHAAVAISDMQVRGAPLIGVTAAYGVALALREDAGDVSLRNAMERLTATRPTASNLRWALEDLHRTLKPLPVKERLDAAYQRAGELADLDAKTCELIGEYGLELIRPIAERKKGKPVNILTHCNAGWLATVDWGTALAPIFKAHDEGIEVFVWVDETRPRNQGAALTAWELTSHGVPHAVIVDNAGGHLMQNGEVDLCITGTDRTVANGDVCNKIGTYLKALAAHDNGVPFFVALPHSTIDWETETGADIPIEVRSADEVIFVHGKTDAGDVTRVEIMPHESHAHNPAFDVTPARLVTGLITERGICGASREGLLSLYPEQAA